MSITIRKSLIADKNEIISVADQAFEKSKDSSFEFRYPMLFNDKRIQEYYLAESEGKIIGLLGAYKINLIINKVSFTACGIGKVACLKQYRGQGVMTSLLNYAVEEMKKEKIDLSYLWGERFRYANFGWVEGGETQKFSFWKKKIIAPDKNDVIRVVRESDTELVYKLLTRKTSYLDYSKEDIKDALVGSRIHGYRLNDSFVFWTYDKSDIIEALGDARDILKLASFCLDEKKKENPLVETVSIESSADSKELQSVLADYCWKSQKLSSANFRIITLEKFLKKFIKAVHFKLPDVCESISLGNIETKQAFTLQCKNKNITLKQCIPNDAIMLGEKNLSEVFMGQFPLNAFFKKLPPESIFRAILPMKELLHISKFYLL